MLKLGGMKRSWLASCNEKDANNNSAIERKKCKYGEAKCQAAEFFPKRVDLRLGFTCCQMLEERMGEEEQCLVGLFSVGQVDVIG